MRSSVHIGHAIIFIFLALIFGSIAAVWPGGFWVFITLFVFCLIAAGAVFVLIWFEKVSDNWDSMGRAASHFADLDGYKFQLFGVRFPTLRAKWGSLLEPRLMFGDSENAEVKHFAVFLERSTNAQVFPLRYWYGDAEFRGQVFSLERDQWYDIIDELLEQGLVLPESAKGSHSYQWATSLTLQNLRKTWRELIVPEKKIPRSFE